MQKSRLRNLKKSRPPLSMPYNMCHMQVSIPTPLRNLTGNHDTVEATGANIKELLQDLERQFPGIGERLLDPAGNVRRFINIYVNGEDIHFLEDQATAIKPTDEISIVPAVAGG
jgi:molybdopterin synthase sulfur carrier subunit